LSYLTHSSVVIIKAMNNTSNWIDFKWHTATPYLHQMYHQQYGSASI
jgi:hypothetical protein